MARTFARASSQYITFPHVTALDGATAFSLFLKFSYPATATVWRALLSQTNSAGTHGIRLWIPASNWTRANVLFVEVRNGSSSGEICTSIGSLTAGTQYNALITFDGSLAAASRIKVELNGVNNSTVFIAAPSATVGTNSEAMEVCSSLAANFGDATVAELAIWTRVLDAGERASLAKDISPRSMKRGRVFYAPLVRDLVNMDGAAGTAFNSPTVSTHPRIYP